MTRHSKTGRGPAYRGRSPKHLFSVAGCATVLAAFVCSAPAHADVSSDVYADARSVIEDLITEEVAHTVAPNVACYVPIALQLYPRSLQRVYDRQFDGLRGTLHEETADFVAYEFLNFVRTSAAEWETSTNKSEFLEKTKDGSVGSAGQPFGLAAAIRRPLDAVFKDQGKGSCDFNAISDAFRDGKYRGVQPSLLDTACADPSTELDGFRCDLAYAARDLLLQQNKVAEQHLLHALAAGLVGVSGKTGAEGQAAESAVVVLLAKVIDAKGPIDADIDEVTKKLFGTATAQVQDAFRDAVRAAAAQWTLLTRTGDPVDFIGFLTAIGGAAGPLNDFCVKALPPNQQDICVELKSARRVLIDPRFQSIVAAIRRRDYRELAMTGLATAISQAADSCTGANAKACKVEVNLFGRFAGASISYVLDVAEDGHAEQPTRQAFRSAATDVLIEIGGSGFDRSFGSKIIMPELALRYQWSTGYLNEGGPANARFVATADWLTFRWRVIHTDAAFGALQLSLIDALGPFSEMALRKNGSYTVKPGAPWANFLNPRLDAILGFPPLSKRLAVGVGLGLRMAAAQQNADGTFGYALLTDSGDLAPRLPKFIEFGFAIKYVL